ncbi:MAG: excinuclease ABC subunit UvrB [bacterium]|nr:excinuclease ABC subunit UvrB [bacterium]
MFKYRAKRSEEENEVLFALTSKFKPTGDQPFAITQMVKNLETGARRQVLLGVTGSGKTFSMAKVIEKTQRPALIISPNKTLAAQTYQELKEFFPENAVHYFVSYYDYYQPEAYIPQTDTYIEKDAKINEEIDRLRHAATQDLQSRKDVIVVASVSCIYNIGSPKTYQEVSLEIKTGQKITRKNFILSLTSLQYQRNDIDFKPGTFRVRGDIVEICLVTGKEIIKVEFSGAKISQISVAIVQNSYSYTEALAEVEKRTKFSLTIRNKFVIRREIRLFPAHFWVSPQNKIDLAIANIKLELQEQTNKLKSNGNLLEAQRLIQRTNYDLEMLKETGYCHGIENYSRHLEFREPGKPPYTLLEYYPNNLVVFIDESHITLSQIKAMSIQDRIRKETLIKYGFRLPSAIDNRPLTYGEFEEKVKQAIYVSATPAKEEKSKAGEEYIVEQLIRPTGLLEPSIEIRPTKNQVKDLIKKIKNRIQKKQRVLVLALTKRLAEAVSDYLAEEGIKAQWLHSEIKTMERPQILKDLREGKYDVLVGINLLREGLDLPEVSLVAILDADKEGFLRSETTLIQTMGRAARHKDGHVILYADAITFSIKKAVDEIERRRKIQEEYNKKYKITPRPIIKEIRNWPFAKEKAKRTSSSSSPSLSLRESSVKDIKILEKEMKIAAKNMDFERAAEIRDLILQLRSGSTPSLPRG